MLRDLINLLALLLVVVFVLTAISPGVDFRINDQVYTIQIRPHEEQRP